MEKLSISTTILFFLLSISLPVFSADIESKTAEQSPWVENITQKQLNSLRNNLDELHQLYNSNLHSFALGEAINKADKANAKEKCNATLLQEISRNQPFVTYATLYIFPEILKLYIEDFQNKLQEKTKLISGEIGERAEKTENITEEIYKELSHLKRIEKDYAKIVEEMESNCESLKQTNRKISNLNALGYFIKNTNIEILDLVSQQIALMYEIAEQLALSVEYSKKQLHFIKGETRVAIKGKHLAEIKGSFKNLEKFIEKYESKQEFNFYNLSRLYEERYKNLVKLVRKRRLRSAEIKRQFKNTKLIPISKNLSQFIPEKDLNRIFELLKFNEINKELHLAVSEFLQFKTLENFTPFSSSQPSSEEK